MCVIHTFFPFFYSRCVQLMPCRHQILFIDGTANDHYQLNINKHEYVAVADQRSVN